MRSFLRTGRKKFVYFKKNVYLCKLYATNHLKLQQITAMDILYLTIIILLLVVFGITIYCFRRYYEQRLKREVVRARKSEHLKSVFLANISQTLRTPLKAIVGYSNLIIDEDSRHTRPTQVKETMNQIKKNSEQLLDFIAQLMELSNFEGSMSSFTFIEVNLSELMASYRREALIVTSPDISVRIRTDLSPHCKATLDTNYMHQIMMHLLKNAANNTTQGDITITYGYERKGLKVAISYTGSGQSELMGEDIYAFLQREDALTMNKDNSGLGLAICKAIIDSLAGEFDITTENGMKTNASFWFPCKMVDRDK